MGEGQPIQNTFVESFNGKFGDKCLNLNLTFPPKIGVCKMREISLNYHKGKGETDASKSIYRGAGCFHFEPDR